MIPTMQLGGIGRHRSGVAGGAVTWNPLDKHADIALTADKLTATKTTTGNAERLVRATGSVAGKRQWEILVVGASSETRIGIAEAGLALTSAIGSTALSYGYYQGGQKTNNGTFPAYGAAYVAGDIITVLYDEPAGTIEFKKNNVSQGVAFTGLAGVKFPAMSIFNGTDVSAAGEKGGTLRAKLADFTYGLEAGYSALGS